MFTQRITPNPNIDCKPGWCLEYVRRTFGQPAVPGYGSATAAWENSNTQHRDRNFPASMWLPVYYGLANEPLGHIVLRAPDGTVYSTSDLGSVPHHHSSLTDLENYYAYYGMPLTYRGWTEDVQGVPVITQSGMAAAGPKQILGGIVSDLSVAEQQEVLAAARRINRYVDAPIGAIPDKVWAQTVLRGGKQVSVKQELADAKTMDQNIAAAIAALLAVTKNSALSPEQVSAAVKDALATGTVAVEVKVNGKVGA